MPKNNSVKKRTNKFSIKKYSKKSPIINKLKNCGTKKKIRENIPKKI